MLRFATTTQLNLMSSDWQPNKWLRRSEVEAAPPIAPSTVSYPKGLRGVSGQHWTQLVVAKRAAEWLDALRIRIVVDIGSGVGKFCVAAALVGHCRFTGLE